MLTNQVIEACGPFNGAHALNHSKLLCESGKNPYSMKQVRTLEVPEDSIVTRLEF